VSKTEDPRDGFYTYWWDETIKNGSTNNPQGGSDPVFKISGEGADYPSIGISPQYFVATIGVNRRDPTFKTDTEALAKTCVDCMSGFVADGQSFPLCGPFYIHIMVVDADSLAKGLPPTFAKAGQPVPPVGRSYALFVDAKNYITDRTEDGK